MSESTLYFNPFALISFSSFLIMMILAFMLWHRYNTSQTKYVVSLFLANALYSFFYTFEISFKSLDEITWFYRCEYFGIPFLATFYLLFVLDYTGNQKLLSTLNKVYLFILPVITLLLVFSNEWHHLFYIRESMNLDGPFPSFSFVPGPWYYVHQGYVILCMLLSLLLMVKMLFNSSLVYKRQVIFLLLATIFPFLGYLIYQLHLIPFGIDPVSFTFTLSGITVYIGLIRFKLFNLLPIARTKLFEKTQDSILVFDLNNRLIDFNQMAGDHYLINTKDLGKDVQNVLSQWPDLMLFIKENHSGRLDYKLFSDGKSRFYEIQILDLENSQKLKQGKLVVIKDISELINTERERSNAASKLNAIIHAMPDIILVINEKGIFTDFFASETDHLFLNREEVIGASIYLLFNEEESKILAELLNKCLNSSELNTHQFEMDFPGEKRYYETRLSRLDATHALTIIRDVTESITMRNDLIYQSGFQKILTSLASRFIYIEEKETDTVISDALKQVGEYTGVERCYIFRYYPELKEMSNTHEWCETPSNSQLENRQHLPIDLLPTMYIHHLKGEVLSILNLKSLADDDPVKIFASAPDVRSIVAIPMISQKNCLGFVGFDCIHEQKKWSDSDISSLKIFTGMMASLLEKITIEQSLVEARGKAEASNRLKTAFMNNISHEIRTPLNGIIGFGEIIANEQLTMEEKNQFLTVVQESSERLIQTIDDYLDISMLVTGNQEVSLRNFNLMQLIEEVIAEHLEACHSKNLSISTICEVPFPQAILYSDPDLIHKVLNHLVGNAIKFTPYGQIWIGIEKQTDAWTLFVKDTGIGIAESAQEFIFDSFMQEDLSSTRLYEGSGLGLSIVKEIITLLGGEISLQSKKGEGAMFTIMLPSGLQPKQFGKPVI